MDTGASNVGGVASTAASGAHIGQHLYAQAVRAASEAAQGAARRAQSEAGTGPFARAIKEGRRPTWLSEHLDDWHVFHLGIDGDINDAIEKSKNVYRPQFADAREGIGGDGLQAALSQNHRMWGADADLHQAAGLAAYQASAKVETLQAQIDDLAEAGEREFNQAVKQRDPVKALSIWKSYSGHADRLVFEAEPQITGVLKQAGFTVPLDGREGAKNDAQDGTQTDKKAKTDTTENANVDKGDAAGHDGIQTDIGPADANRGSGTVKPDATETELPPKTTPAVGQGGDATQTNLPAAKQLPTFMPPGSGTTGGGVQSGAAGSGGSALSSGLGAGLRPPSSLGSLSGSGVSTSPASAMPQVPSAASAPTAPPLANAGSSFQSGLASGMGASSGMTPAMPTTPQQPLAPFASQQPSAATPTSGVGGAGMPATGALAASDAVSHSGSGSSVGPSNGTSVMQPPPAMGSGAPLAPYSPPGAGAVGAGAGSAATTPTAGGGSSQSAPAGGGGPASGGPGAAPAYMAGNPGSSAAMSAMAGATEDVNPDLLTAQRVLGGVARGTHDSGMLVTWAVSVLRSAYGPQIVVASNTGGGWYLPPAVYLPRSARLAVNDPALPMGWADDWMGCRHPSKILVDHFERLAQQGARLSLSAMVTTEFGGGRRNFGGDFLVMGYDEATRLLSDAPRLDGEHRHRLATIGDELAQRVNGMDRGGSEWIAQQLTEALLEAGKPDDNDVKRPLVGADEETTWKAVKAGTATAEVWRTYDQAVRERDGAAALFPDSHAPTDNDGSDEAQRMIRAYRHYYRIGRLVELLSCWKARPPRLAEIVYCAIMAGFGSGVAAALPALEQQARGRA